MSPTREPSGKYTRTAIALHWLLGLALLAQISFGFLLDEIAPRNTPARAGVINLHKSCGIVLGLLIALRLVWRFRHAPPPLAGQHAAQRAPRRALGARGCSTPACC